MLPTFFKKIPGYTKLNDIVYNRFVKHRKNPFTEFAAPGHFYSPLPDMEFIKTHKDILFSRGIRNVPGVDVNEDGQLNLFNNLSLYYPQIPWGDEKKAGLRYYFENESFCHGDAITLFSMICHFKPKRIIEVGSGYSSAAMLDTNELFLGRSIDFTFIEPYPDILHSLLREDDRKSVEIIEDIAQAVPIDRLITLEDGDFLFIDSSHVAKIGSDVIYLMSHVLPAVKRGVIIHFHDIFWPFEYPQEWVTSGRAWNEAYFLKAFLQFNQAYQIVFFNHFLATFHLEKINKNWPLFKQNTGGSIWLRKVV